MNMNALIIDDERHAREGLSALLDLYCPNVQILDTADQVGDGIRLIHESQPDVVFLDIQIGEENGFQLLDRLPHIDFQLIFTTAHSEFAIKAFRYHALDYLLKPIQPKLLMAAVAQAEQSLHTHHLKEQLDVLRDSLRSGRQEKLVVPTMEGLHVIRLDAIVHIIGSANYSTFHLSDGEKIMTSKHLKHYEALLPSEQFFRTHQSHLVNVHCIKSIRTQEGNMVELEEGSSVPLARRRKEDLLALLQGR